MSWKCDNYGGGGIEMVKKVNRLGETGCRNAIERTSNLFVLVSAPSQVKFNNVLQVTAVVMVRSTIEALINALTHTSIQ